MRNWNWPDIADAFSQGTLGCYIDAHSSAAVLTNPEMEEAALLDRAGRLRALRYVILPQVRGGIAVTTMFVFLNAWNEFLFAVVLVGNRVRTITVAMFNFISVEQTLWAKLAAGDARDGPGDRARTACATAYRQRLTVGAVKGGGRRA